jgi:predicted DNA-binding mobile mystery protein A
MRAQERATARRQLDKRLDSLRISDSFSRPPRGWIKAIRESLGMTTVQLARRIGVSQSRVVDIEKAETRGSITLGSLERAARALDCDVVYALVPRQPLQAMVEERVSRLAETRMKTARHTMVPEGQSVYDAGEQNQVEKLRRELVEKSGSALWEDE